MVTTGQKHLSHAALRSSDHTRVARRMRIFKTLLKEILCNSRLSLQIAQESKVIENESNLTGLLTNAPPPCERPLVERCRLLNPSRSAAHHSQSRLCARDLVDGAFLFEPAKRRPKMLSGCREVAPHS